MAEVKEILEEERKARELSSEQQFSLEHAQKFSRIESKKSRKLVNELMNEIEGLPETLAIKMVDLMPTDPEDIRLIFAKERANVKKKDIDKILDIVEKYS